MFVTVPDAIFNPNDDDCNIRPPLLFILKPVVFVLITPPIKLSIELLPILNAVLCPMYIPDVNTNFAVDPVDTTPLLVPVPCIVQLFANIVTLLSFIAVLFVIKKQVSSTTFVPAVIDIPILNDFTIELTSVNVPAETTIPSAVETPPD